MLLKYQWVSRSPLVGLELLFSGRGVGFGALQTECHRVAFSSSLGGWSQCLLDARVVSFWESSCGVWQVLSKWNCHPRQQAWCTPGFDMTLSIVSHLRRGFPPEKPFFPPENEVWSVFFLNPRAVLDFWGAAQCPVCIWAELTEPDWSSERHLRVHLSPSHGGKSLCPQPAAAWRLPGRRERESSLQGPKSSYCLLSENHSSFKHLSTSRVVSTGFELHGIKAKFFLWGWSPTCGSFQVKGLRGSDTSFFYKTDRSSHTALGLRLIVASWTSPNCQTGAGSYFISKKPEPDLHRK